MLWKDTNFCTELLDYFHLLVFEDIKKYAGHKRVRSMCPRSMIRVSRMAGEFFNLDRLFLGTLLCCTWCNYDFIHLISISCFENLSTIMCESRWEDVFFTFLWLWRVRGGVSVWIQWWVFLICISSFFGCFYLFPHFFILKSIFLLEAAAHRVLLLLLVALWAQSSRWFRFLGLFLHAAHRLISCFLAHAIGFRLTHGGWSISVLLLGDGR